MNNTCESSSLHFEVDLKQALIWVARALDYVGVDDTHHNHRVAYIAYQCALALGWDLKKSGVQLFCWNGARLWRIGNERAFNAARDADATRRPSPLHSRLPIFATV